MDKSFLDIAGFAPLLNHFLRQKNSLRFGEKRKKGGRIRKPPFGFTVFKGSGRQYCMQSIPLAVLKQDLIWSGWHNCLPYCMQSIPLAVLKHSCQKRDGGQAEHCMQSIPLAVLKLCSKGRVPRSSTLHAIHTACGIETHLNAAGQQEIEHCMQSIPLAVLKLRHMRESRSVYKLHAIHTACGIETKKGNKTASLGL